MCCVCLTVSLTFAQTANRMHQNVERRNSTRILSGFVHSENVRIYGATHTHTFCTEYQALNASGVDRIFIAIHSASYCDIDLYRKNSAAPQIYHIIMYTRYIHTHASHTDYAKHIDGQF